MRTPSQRELALLTKFLGLTGSSQDGEALTALRKAQKVLNEIDATWEDVIAGRLASVSIGSVQVTYHKPTYNPPRPRPAPPKTWEPTGYHSDSMPHYTFSKNGERYSDSDINLIFEPMHSFPFRFADRMAMQELWTKFLRERRLSKEDFAELVRLQRVSR